ncbi:alpha/beta hydrolase [Saccharomonospora sp. NPDC006951]
MNTTTSADGTVVRLHDEGSGPPVLLLGPGLDDGSRTKKLAGFLTPRFRVLRPHRRQYRMDLKAGGPASIAQEVDDVLAIAASVGEPLIVYGHSSGGVVALEALATSSRAFAAAVIFEPPSVITPAHSEKNTRGVARTRAAIARGRPARAITAFMRHVGLSPSQARLAGLITMLLPRYRTLVPAQIDDLDALTKLGVRLDVYAGITTPTLLLGGDRSPANLSRRLDAIEQAMPHAERLVMRDRDHGADLKHPRQVARIVERFADSVLGDP